MTNAEDNDEFMFIDGKRIVKPYIYEFKAHAKERWYGKKLLDIFNSEFYKPYDLFFFDAINSGRMKVNGTTINTEYLIKNGDVIIHDVLREEPPVSGKDIDIIYIDEEMIVVDKPASIPVHGAGRFYKNSLVYILEKQLKITLYPIHRLDRSTSGIVIFALSTEKARELAPEFQRHCVRKEYLCIVKGHFPYDKITVNAPIKSVQGKIKISIMSDNGKPSATKFELVKILDGENASLIRCLPVNGRSHQIRVHLRWLGYPIANDLLYLHSFLWNTSDDQIIISEADMVSRCEAVSKNERIDKISSDELFLHAYKYSIGKYEFETRLPDWCTSSL